MRRLDPLAEPVGCAVGVLTALTIEALLALAVIAAFVGGPWPMVSGAVATALAIAGGARWAWRLDRRNAQQIEDAVGRHVAGSHRGGYVTIPPLVELDPCVVAPVDRIPSTSDRIPSTSDRKPTPWWTIPQVLGGELAAAADPTCMVCGGTGWAGRVCPCVERST